MKKKALRRALAEANAKADFWVEMALELGDRLDDARAHVMVLDKENTAMAMDRPELVDVAREAKTLLGMPVSSSPISMWQKQASRLTQAVARLDFIREDLSETAPPNPL